MLLQSLVTQASFWEHIAMPTSAAGYLKMLKWARSWGCVRRAGLEGTGTYGAGARRGRS